MKITLVCALGMSTSMLVDRMEKVAEEKAINIQIEAHSVDEMEKQFATSDLILLGPQIRYKQKELAEKAAEANVPIAMINMKAYGTLNGGEILEQALEILR
ncbi:PTS sugar transporter subunit IIB [Virgibacillus salexigens]|uniref:PTS sugar transporter subunit IIB n=1 Tax=Virgibacillus massiliensis TaxID=1462526 RepID=UPI0013681DBE|nr:PTS sugar transporter subunit IIB [Virgibacillus massiliensis]MYL40401.1 PTS sugar transporter subunit IIB [Virgibacillus massiliensis]